MRLCTATLLLALVLPAAPGPARAESRRSGLAQSIEDDELGKLHYDAGRRLFEQGAYAKALAEFTAGYELTGRAPFLLNMAQCHRRLGDLEKARDVLEEFVTLQPSSPLAHKVRGFIAELDRELGRGPSTVTEAPGTLSRDARPAREVSRPELVASTPGSEPSARTPVYKKWWLWTTVGVVAVGLGVGLGVGLSRQGGASFAATQPAFEVTGPGATR